MFAKPYKLKSNNTLKNSEKKHLIQRVQEEFPQASEEKIKEIVSVKSTCICMKLVLHSGETVNVYAVEGAPMIIEQEQGLVPTVCALWKVPDLVPTLTIHTPVLPKVHGGAPLYLPGVVIPEAGAGFPMFQRGSIIAMCTNDNSAAGIVGRATMSSADMLLRTAGVCLETLHVVGDQLCKDERLAQVTRPKGKPPVCRDITDVTTQLTQISLKPELDEWPTLGPRAPPAPRQPRLIPAHTPRTQPPADNTPTHQQDTKTPTDDIPDTPQTEQPSVENGEGVNGGAPEDMEGLLQWCLLGFLKRDGKHIELPIKTSLLYRNYLIPLCPEGRTLDVKKSSYKKMSKFLEAMQQEGLIEVREIEKGVDAVVAVQPSHPLVRAHVTPSPPPAPSHPSPTAPSLTYQPPLVREMYCVTAAVMDLFAPVKKGTALTPAEVRSTLTDYVKGRGLSREKGALALDRVLANILGLPEQTCMKWEPVMSGVQARMTAATAVTFGDGTSVLCKARLEPVAMAVVTRSGNKKVTLVSNLESFGFRLGELSSECQRGVAAACGVTRSAGAKADQLMLQGDQTHFMAKLLIEKYGLPKKFVEGADKALKKKK